MSQVAKYREDSPAVQAHLGIMQSVIGRMSTNSSSAKAWCIALVSAVLVSASSQTTPGHAWLATIPTILFLALDAYYLALERALRESYNNFIDKLHRGELEPQDLYAVGGSGSLLRKFVVAIGSFSVWPVYLTLLGMIWVARYFLF